MWKFRANWLPNNGCLLPCWRLEAVLPRPEYPRPILVRDEWLNLNGAWDFAPDPQDVGLQQGWGQSHSWQQEIIVPFCPEADASGVDWRNPVDIVWYHRRFMHPGWTRERVLLHVGACDYATRVFINGHEVGQHQGGYAPQAFDISHALRAGSNEVTVRAADTDSWQQPRGKQAGTSRWPIDYDPVTGIWQSVWLEPVNKHHITHTHAQYSLESATLSLTVGCAQMFAGTVVLEVFADGQLLGQTTADAGQRSEIRLDLALKEPRLWSSADPYLHVVILRLLDDTGEQDRVESYTGLREVTVDAGVLTLNGEEIYLRGVLDQGYFPDGWYTAMTDEAIKADVELTLAMGFNFARKHQKAEDPRYLYWCDRLGLMLWAEMPSGRIFSTDLVTRLTAEWMVLIKRDRANPSVIGWVPFNESWGVWHLATRPAQRAFVDAMVHLTRSLDPSRPVIGNDGWEYTSGDLWTLHVYEGEHEGQHQSIGDRIEQLLQDPGSEVIRGDRPRVGALPGSDVRGLPVLLTECGGVGFLPPGYVGETFAYGDIPDSPAAFEARLRSVAKAIHDADSLQGFVWTQLTDVQQEINGLLYFDRQPKLPLPLLREIIAGIGCVPAPGAE
jgi:beta-galactosidase/beta-glucuronidase